MNSDRAMCSRTRGLFVFMAVALMLASCERDPHKAIVGAWKASAKQQVLTFHSDGSLYINEENAVTPGTYTFIDKTHVKIELGGVAGGVLKFAQMITGPIPLVYEVSIAGRQLTVTAPDGSVSKYERMG